MLTDEKNQKAAKVMWLSILTAGLLMAGKLITGLFTHSLAILASALDSAMDVGASSVNMIALRKAGAPPDREHTYGHGKIESLAALFQSLFIGLSGLYIVYESVKRLIYGSRVEAVPLGIAVMAASLLITWLLVRRLRAAAKKYPSLILETERLHFFTDILSNGGVILALFLIMLTKSVSWDLVVSTAIAGYIFKASFGILRRSMDELLDRSLPLASVREIEAMISRHHPAIVGIHDFRSRCVGTQIFLDFHIDIRGEEDFKKAHQMTESLVARIQARHPEADVTIHYDPEGEDERIRDARAARRR